MKPLPRSFYDRETPETARALLGAHLVRRERPSDTRETHAVPALLIGRIVEVEAYLGPEDGASHARSGRTRRTEVMFGPLGHAYVYFVYGMHWMFNVVSRRDRPAGALLVRAVEPLQGIQRMRQHRNGRQGRELTNGPAKLCKAFGITGDLNGVDLCDPTGLLTITPGPAVPPESVATGPRVGVRNASDPWRSCPLRFWIRGNPFVSRFH